MAERTQADVLIVGGGLAGLSLALRVADAGLDATVITKRALTESSTLYAQGGIAAVLSRDDSFQAHATDTLTAGAGLCRPETVDFVVSRGPACIDWLIEHGVQFSRTAPGSFVNEGAYDEYHLTREGGHSTRRVIHAADATGRAVEDTLEAQVRKHARITLMENHIAIDLITSNKLGFAGPPHCLGLYLLDLVTSRVETLSASNVVLATGGASKVYLYTSNPDTSTGDGIAMAWRAGCRVANMEFIQFHPTCLYHPHAKSFLISEAVRGEGGRLLLADGTRFMTQHDPRGELAPRDIVARAIDFEMKRGGHDCVYLDISHKPRQFIVEHFPTIYERCREFGFDMTREPLPVVPAAHYTCGGVVTDLRGRTDIAGLYAVGESTCTGLHGANRLASNSLLECLVFSESAAKDIAASTGKAPAIEPALPAWDESQVTDPDEQIVVAHNWDELRRVMWDYVGIVRTNKRLRRAERRIDMLADEIREYYRNFTVSSDLLELRNLVVVAELIVRGAMSRKESRGLHYTLDYPLRDDARPPLDTVLVPENYAASATAERMGTGATA